VAVDLHAGVCVYTCGFNMSVELSKQTGQ